MTEEEIKQAQKNETDGFDAFISDQLLNLSTEMVSVQDKMSAKSAETDLEMAARRRSKSVPPRTKR